MKDKIVFFIIGAIVATIAYFLGDINTLNANETFLEDVFIGGQLFVGNPDQGMVSITHDGKSAHIGIHSVYAEGLNTPSISLSVDLERATMNLKDSAKNPKGVVLLSTFKNIDGKQLSGITLQDDVGEKSITPWN